MAKSCPQCKKENPSSANFCMFCRSSLVENEEIDELDKLQKELHETKKDLQTYRKSLEEANAKIEELKKQLETLRYNGHETKLPDADWQKDIPVKDGRYLLEDGSYYEGNFDDNKKLHGEGTFYSAKSKSKYIGTYEHGKRVGKGKIIFIKNGTTEEGDWDDIGIYKGKRTLSNGTVEIIDNQ